ncbi:MAG: excinuclease ABC subunit UvrB [Lentisphaerae bacterium]|nr:excinuclease ABC subunit UvrB [Lentisphaerota bacterium]
MAATFDLVAPFEPTGDQPAAIEALCRQFSAGNRFAVLEGVTGSGKTFTMANVIARLSQPALIISHNKTLAAQLYGELKEFFPNNAVEYFISYYDYYQPEAYIPQTDTYIEKDASINQEIERLRLSATNSLVGREDVIIVASVSCIYGLGSPEDYADMLVRIDVGTAVDRDEMLARLVEIQYTRNDFEPSPGTFRVRGDTVDIFPSYAQIGLRIDFFGDDVEAIWQIDPLTGNKDHGLSRALISPAKHFVLPEAKLAPAIKRIKAEARERVAWFEAQGKLLEAQRLQQRTMFDIEMLTEIGYCSGIENYSRHFSGRQAGEPPDCLLDYFPDSFLTIIDESHVTLPQVRAMYNGDQARKGTLVEHGFRLPSAKDNRPLAFDEFLDHVGPILFASATPGAYEREVVPNPVPQVIRPTGLIDPPVTVRPLDGQIDDLMEEVRHHAERDERVLVTTLTKRTAEDLAAYFREAGLRVEYLHSDITALDRVEVLSRLRQGDFDCLVGINLLREGLDLPEVALVAILDADKEGFLRSETALIQVAGRAARHVDGKVILYADRITNSMQRMMDVTQERREHQIVYNREHAITPAGIKKAINYGTILRERSNDIEKRVVKEDGVEYDLYKAIEELEREMLEAAQALEYERAAILRDEIRELKRER